jgi:hypothetical protein
METVCPYCDKFFEVPDEIEGTRTLCEFCEQVFTADALYVINVEEIDQNAMAT